MALSRGPRLDIEALARDNSVLRSYQEALLECLGAVEGEDDRDVDDSQTDECDGDAEELWKFLKEGLLRAAGESIPFTERKFRVPWFTEEIFDLVCAKKVAYDRY